MTDLVVILALLIMAVMLTGNAFLCFTAINCIKRLNHPMETVSKSLITSKRVHMNNVHLPVSVITSKD